MPQRYQRCECYRSRMQEAKYGGRAGLDAHLREKSPDCVYQMYTHKAKMGKLRIKFTFFSLISGEFPAQLTKIRKIFYVIFSFSA